MCLVQKILWCIVIAFLVPSAGAQVSKSQQLALVLKRQVELRHISPRPVNDSFSSDMFRIILQELDPQQVIFTQAEFNLLKAYRYRLDDEIKGSGWNFLDLLARLYSHSLKRADSVVDRVLQQPFDLMAEERIQLSRQKPFQYASSPAELRNRWTRWFKYSFLQQLYEAKEMDSSGASFTALLDRHEGHIRSKIKKSARKQLQAILNPETYSFFIQSYYLGSLAATFDPHTAYLSPRDNEEFQSLVGTQTFSFGFDIDETRDGKIVITQLVPGGPAWRTGELHANDELLQLHWEGSQPVDIAGISYEEAEDLLNQKNHGTITLRVRKSNGMIQTITLQKEKIEKQEDVVKGYLLKGQKNIGYISLPGFYTNWEDDNASGCANDLAKEILRLRKERIEGLILDVRFNGGGSLGEALQLAGVFIDVGPLTGTRDRSGKINFLKDPNRGTVFDGPLVLLINGQSASASELLAAALQDYNRAVIVGSPTYGKATMQQVFPMDTMMKNPMARSENGYVKITTGKLYRVNGRTAQRNGVVPDIELPEPVNEPSGEKLEPLALAADTVKANPYYTPLPPLPVDVLRQKSQMRLGAKNNFGIGSAITARVQEIPLKLDQFEKWAQQNKPSAKRWHTDNPGFVALNYQNSLQALPGDTYGKAVNEITLNHIQKDIYIGEAYHIICDLLNLQIKN